MSLRAGDLIGGRYLLVRPIAMGGMGAVWSATDEVLGRQVAVKLLKPEYSSDKGFLDRFRAEARHSAGLSHPNIAAVYDYGESDDASTHSGAYLVMEEVPGSPLSTILNDRHRLPADEVLDVLSQTAAGLGAAHTKGIVHRDVKPANLLITPDGDVKITDFGIARAVDQASLTATGTVMGTARYLSPEQATGEPTSPASDLYSLGVVGYEALAGQSPFPAETPVAQAMAHVHDQPRPLPQDVPGPVADLIMGLLNKEPSARPANGAELVRLIARVRDGENVNLTRQNATVPPPVLSPDATQALGQSAPVTPTAALPVQQPDYGTPAAFAQAGYPPQSPQPGYPDGSGGYGSASRPPKRRGTWTLPLVALIAIVLFIVAGLLYMQLNGSSGPDETTVTETITSGEGTSTSTSTTRSSSPTETRTRTQEPTETRNNVPTSPPLPTIPEPVIPEPNPQPPANQNPQQQETPAQQDQGGTQPNVPQGQGALPGQAEPQNADPDAGSL